MIRRRKVINDIINIYVSNVKMLYPLLNDKYVPRKVKINSYMTILRSLLLYRYECRTLTAPTKSRLKAAEIRVLWLTKGVTRRNNMKNNDIRQELGVKYILTMIEKAQLR